MPMIETCYHHNLCNKNIVKDYALADSSMTVGN